MNEFESKRAVFKETIRQCRYEDFVVLFNDMQEEIRERMLLKALDGTVVEPKRETDKIEV